MALHRVWPKKGQVKRHKDKRILRALGWPAKGYELRFNGKRLSRRCLVPIPCIITAVKKTNKKG